MKESIRILTQRKKGESHHETLLSIDWSEMTEEQLRVLARNALIHDFQARIVKDHLPVPEEYCIMAKDMVNRTPVALFKFMPSAACTLTPDEELDELIAKLSPEERAQLLGELA